MPKRLSQSKTWFILVLSFLVLVASSVALVVAVTLNNRQQVATAHEICMSQNRQNRLIERQLKRSLKTLPSLSYYKQHPDELATQLRLIRQEMGDFGPIDCP